MILPSEGPPGIRMPEMGAINPGPFVHDLLRPFSVLRTFDLDVLRLAASARFGASRVEVLDSSGFEARASMVELPNIALAFGATNSRILIDHPEADYARLGGICLADALRGRPRAPDAAARQSGAAQWHSHRYLTEFQIYEKGTFGT